MLSDNTLNRKAKDGKGLESYTMSGLPMPGNNPQHTMLLCMGCFSMGKPRISELAWVWLSIIGTQQC